ncbi:MAG: ribonuclease E/G [Clostridium sp.]|nr:ribonuclease E/G [Clostridium sp.]
MPENQANVSYYITRYENRLLSALCVDDKPVQASFSPLLPPDKTTLDADAGSESGGHGIHTAFAVGTIVVGRVNRIVHNIRAVFVDIAPGVQGFLPFSNLQSPIYCSHQTNICDSQADMLPVQGDSILVQVEKAAVKTKDLVLTTKLTLSGRYVVIEQGGGGIRFSQKAPPKQRARMRDFLTGQNQEEPGSASDVYGCIVRTNAFALADFSPVLTEQKRLCDTMDRMVSYAPSRMLYSVLYTPPADYLLALRDTYALSFQRIVTDIPAVYEQLTSYFMDAGDTISQQKLFFFDNQKKSMSLLNFYRLGEHIKEALSKRVWLKSGGYLVIEPTESLTAIDVNTGKYTGKSEAEDTYLKINLEAAKMIARQLRLRNLSGMILVDFINMKGQERNAQLLEQLRAYTADDPVHTSVIDMTPLGLVEITRKKIRKSLKEQYDETAFYERN